MFVYFLDTLLSIVKHGFPSGDVFEYAATMINKYERKLKHIKAKEVIERRMKEREEKLKSKRLGNGMLFNNS